MTNMSIVYKIQPIASTVEVNLRRTVSTEVIGAVSLNGNNNERLDWNETVELSPSKLPWHNGHWSIVVTWVISTVDVWGRIVDSDDWVSLAQGLNLLPPRFFHLNAFFT